MFKHILVPVDGSRTAALGLNQAIKMASNRRATLYLLHVVDERAVTQNLESAGVIDVDRLFESLREAGTQILAKAEAQARKQRAPVKTLLVENLVGSVAEVIVKQAKKCRADVIVIGTHGRRGLTRLVMGSDAESVVRAAPMPVLLVRAKPSR